VSTILVVPVAKFAACVVDTSGEPSLANIFANVKKNLKDPYVIFRGLGKMIHEKKPEAKNLLALYL
jgi:hypothetical protein